MTNGEQLARLVLMFHDAGPWTGDRQKMWFEITGVEEATTKVLCDFARDLLNREAPALDCPGVKQTPFDHLFIGKPAKCARCGLPEADYIPPARTWRS